MRPRSNLFPIFLVVFAFLSVAALRSIEGGYGTNQLLFFVGAGLVFSVTSQLPYAWLSRGRWIWYAGALALLILTLLLGKATNGAVSWIRLGAYRLQPSELLKPALMLALAWEAAQHPLQSWKNIGRFWLVAFLPLSVVLMQPDLGTTLVTLGGAGSIFLASRPRWQHVLLLGGIGITLLAVSWTFLLKPYQKDRVLTFLSPTSDPLGSGYNAQQALVAVGSGGLWGRGLGNGLQSHLRFLPERQTDFLFASYAEETGFLGSTLLVSAYASLFFSIAWLMRRFDTDQKVLLTSGLLGILGLQTLINIGMNIGLLPITGVTLPFFSLGGSSITATALMLGLIESARRSTVHAPYHIE